jgi:uncharacterized membrane protein YkgB
MTTLSRPGPLLPSTPPRSRADRAAAAIDGLTPLLHRHSLTALRLSLGLVYIWFGALKIAGISPAAALVVGTIPGHPGIWVVPVLGWFEVALGAWLGLGKGLRIALPLFVGHMIGTMGVLVLLPQTAYQHHDPLALTMSGEFVVKNLVLLTAGLVVATRTAQRPARGTAGRAA